jgi:hypothetical protein
VAAAERAPWGRHGKEERKGYLRQKLAIHYSIAEKHLRRFRKDVCSRILGWEAAEDLSSFGSIACS